MAKGLHRAVGASPSRPSYCVSKKVGIPKRIADVDVACTALNSFGVCLATLYLATLLYEWGGALSVTLPIAEKVDKWSRYPGCTVLRYTTHARITYHISYRTHDRAHHPARTTVYGSCRSTATRNHASRYAPRTTAYGTRARVKRQGTPVRSVLLCLEGTASQMNIRMHSTLHCTAFSVVNSQERRVIEDEESLSKRC